MATHVCEHCEARNARGGRCTFCEMPLGSLRDAIFTAFATATILALSWIALSWLTGFELCMLASIFGAIVSGAVFVRQGGRGIRYQAVASFFTISGLAIADAAVVRMHWLEICPNWDPARPLPPMLDQLVYQAQWDGLFLVFLVLGLAGGLFLWR